MFKDAGFEVHFATETGNPPKCDDRMLYGVTGKILVSMHCIYYCTALGVITYQSIILDRVLAKFL